MRTIYAIAIVIVSLKCANLQSVPPNPCPNLFQYFQENGIIYGRLEFPNDYSGYYELTVNMSVATILSNDRVSYHIIIIINSKLISHLILVLYLQVYFRTYLE